MKIHEQESYFSENNEYYNYVAYATAMPGNSPFTEVVRNSETNEIICRVLCQYTGNHMPLGVDKKGYFIYVFECKVLKIEYLKES